LVTDENNNEKEKTNADHTDDIIQLLFTTLKEKALEGVAQKYKRESSRRRFKFSRFNKNKKSDEEKTNDVEVSDACMKSA